MSKAGMENYSWMSQEVWSKAFGHICKPLKPPNLRNGSATEGLASTTWRLQAGPVINVRA